VLLVLALIEPRPRRSVAEISGVVLLDDAPQAGMPVHLPPGQTVFTSNTGEFEFEQGVALVDEIAVEFNHTWFRIPLPAALDGPSYIRIRLEDPEHPEVTPLTAPSWSAVQ
jgi:hypothetical protein